MITHAPATFCILLLTAIISLLALKSKPQLIPLCAFHPYELQRRKRYYTLLSSGFVHGSVIHLFFNMMTLYFFGPSLEQTIGAASFLALYILALMLSEVRTFFQQRNNYYYSAIGASGAISAVLFASIVYFPGQSIIILPIPVPIPSPLFAVCYLLYSWYAARRGGDGINHTAHIDGAITGLLFVAITDWAAYRSLPGLFGGS